MFCQPHPKSISKGEGLDLRTVYSKIGSLVWIGGDKILSSVYLTHPDFASLVDPLCCAKRVESAGDLFKDREFSLNWC